MQAYVRDRLSGAEQPPAPAPDPAASYVLAQGALGARVPQDTMSDSPRFLEGPDTGNETTTRIPSSRDLAVTTRQAQQQQLLQQMRDVSKQMDLVSGPERRRLFQQWEAITKQLDQLSAQFDAGTGQWAERQAGMIRNAPLDANVMQQAIQNRQAQPREPLVPPATGGVPMGTPLPPKTGDYMM